ncbi:MAG TPA: type III PLP-dependent enzyme [Candidatus Acidoferrum sp.]|nr:type III PLP-dependent enzyme [Candidatus Acidoferrum sp.]
MPDGLSTLVKLYFPSSAGELCIGGVTPSTLANEYDTPLFVYDRGILDKKWTLLRQSLPREFSIFYSVKANPNQTILRQFLSLGAGLEIASGGEFCQALAAGCPPANILFAGPGKSERELELVLGKGVGEIHLESQLEAERVIAISRRLGVRARVALRVNPGAEAEGGAMRMGGRPAPFGVDEESLEGFLDFLCSAPEIDFGGIHVFSGTQILDSEILVSQYRKGIDIARRAAARLQRPLRRVDFGGGLGVPYFSHEQALDTVKLKAALEELMCKVRRDPAFVGTEFLVEPGRFLVAEAGVYIVKIIDIKVSRGKKFLITDGGMHHHLAASGNLGQTIKRNYPVAVLNRLKDPDGQAVDVVGPLCTPLDVLARNIVLPNASVGDLIGVFQSGAYARAASPLNFLSHPSPPEVWVDASRHRLIRHRGVYADFMRDLCSVERE